MGSGKISRFKHFIRVESDSPPEGAYQLVAEVTGKANGLPLAEYTVGSYHDTSSFSDKLDNLENFGKAKYAGFFAVDSDSVKVTVNRESIRYVKLIHYRDEKTGRFVKWKSHS